MAQVSKNGIKLLFKNFENIDRKMNILNVTTTHEWRGGEAQLYQYFRLLENFKDLNQMILCPENSVLSEKCTESKSKHFTYFKKSKVSSLLKPIIKICKAEKINIIHVHDSNALTASLIATLFLPKSTKIVLSRKRNNRIKDKFLNRYKYSHPKIQKIISVSKAVEKVFDNIVHDKSRLVTIYDAIDVNFFENVKKTYLIHQEYQLSLDTKIVGNVAALTSQKDIHTFIDTAKKIIAKKDSKLDLKFVIVGDGPLKDELHKYSKKLKVEEHIIFMGYRSNIQQILPDFDIFLLTSETEGLPLTIYEAFASKIPVVATNAGGISEVIENNKTGFLTDLKDSENLSNYVLEILQNPELSEKIKTNAYNLVKENHDLSCMQKQYYKFYKTLL
ncbi:glycosyltransferase family 4 protein [Flavobacterium sp. RS13.1]|uniref:glycosyltransferase family 4 protein n=1 Tax=Flavobacterium sp. RS13.1 TaxID=3400345 RepID=UPI003AAF3B74